ncbi:MAG: hypothetical protein LBD89_05700 [Tannerellaceae bacterium]|jgi:cytochrome c biogenesis protein CcdA|nr:hypothetical protein [Tannerellaceae bacterium]
MEQIPLWILLAYALYEGLIHAFEADHVLAVTNIVSQRTTLLPALKDGVFWGLGHTSTIFVIGLLMIWLKTGIPSHVFSYFEAAVGLMLIAVAAYRIRVFLREEKRKKEGKPSASNAHLHKTSYGIGFVHGLAGSGALVVLVMAEIRILWHSMAYLLAFGLGSVAGMVVVAGLFGIPFSRKLVDSQKLRRGLVAISSGLCFAYGCYVIYTHLIAPEWTNFNN